MGLACSLLLGQGPDKLFYYQKLFVTTKKTYDEMKDRGSLAVCNLSLVSFAVRSELGGDARHSIKL